MEGEQRVRGLGNNNKIEIACAITRPSIDHVRSTYGVLGVPLRNALRVYIVIVVRSDRPKLATQVAAQEKRGSPHGPKIGHKLYSVGPRPTHFVQG